MTRSVLAALEITLFRVSRILQAAVFLNKNSETGTTMDSRNIKVSTWTIAVTDIGFLTLEILLGKIRVKSEKSILLA